MLKEMELARLIQTKAVFTWEILECPRILWIYWLTVIVSLILKTGGFPVMGIFFPFFLPFCSSRLGYPYIPNPGPTLI